MTARGNARQDVYEDDTDKSAFLDTVQTVTARANWQCHAYCLMDNHDHLLIETR